MKNIDIRSLIMGVAIGFVLGFITANSNVEAHPCGGVFDGYLQPEPLCWQEAIADAYGNITYVTVCR